MIYLLVTEKRIPHFALGIVTLHTVDVLVRP